MSPACVRAAWLALPGGQTMPLDNPAGGWFCQSLDLGSPVVRSVMTNRPDADGAVDRTQYMGARTVVATVVAVASAGARIDDVADNFAPFMVPSQRPVLHYVLDRPGAAERTLVLRPDSYDWPIAGAVKRDIALQWIAADPIAYDVNTQTQTAWVGSAAGGRTYNLVFPRVYPSGGTSGSGAVLTSNGDVAFKPLLRIYGPVTGASVSFALSTGGSFVVAMLPAYIINAGHRVDIDTAAHTAYLDGDTTQNVLGQVDWTRTSWPLLPVAPASSTMFISGTTVSGTSQVQATWADKYLT